MSGVKRVDLEEEARARARALEQAAKEREARLRQQAQQQLAQASEESQRLLGRLAKSGADELGRFLMAEQAQAQAALADDAPVTSLQQRTSSLLAEREQAARLLAFLEQVPAGETRSALLRSLRAASSSLEQAANLAAWSRHAGGLVHFETALAEIAETIQFLRACQAALVPLNQQEQRALNDLESYLRLPEADSLLARAAASKSLRKPSLREQLAERERQLLNSLSQLATPPWQEKIGGWRSELGSQLTGLEAHVRLGEWTRAAPLLRELEDFLLACTRHRVEVICEGARSAGLKPADIVFDPALYAFYAQLHDEQGHVANVTEFAPDWRTGLEHGSLQLEGPSSFDGSACMRGGVESVVDGVRRKGSRIHRVESSEGDLLYEERTENAPRTAAAPQRVSESLPQKQGRRGLDQ